MSLRGRRDRAFLVLGAICALVPALVMWGFTVDDALIPIRYAHHLANGQGYRFNAHGPSTDGVTPLPWAFLLTLLARGEPLLALVRAKAIGVGAWTAASTMLALDLGRRHERALHPFIGMVVIALAFPVGAWASSGMETGLATALVTLAALSFERPLRAAIFAGVAATLRPELVVWSMALAFGSAVFAKDRSRARILVTVAIAFAPFLVCAIVRVIVWGRPSPLALLAKPSDLTHGFVYARAAALVVLTPILALAPIAVARSTPIARTLFTAGLLHFFVVILVGGDWMPYARLMVPIAPSLAIVYVESTRTSHPLATGLRVLGALVIGGLVAVTAAPNGRHVQRDRAELIRNARPVLVGSKVVAALDIGWVSAATNADIVDLAGLTDPAIAVLSGGHTSKHVDTAMLLDRNVDMIVVYSERRVVEERIVRAPVFATRFERVATVPLGPRGASYVFYKRRDAPPPPPAPEP